MTTNERDRRFRALLLDIDGTLIDSNDAHASAWVDTFREHGHDVPFERVRPLIGKGGDRLLDELVGVAEESPTGKRMSERRKQILAEKYLPSVRAFPKVREMLVRAREENMRRVVATSASKEDLGKLLGIAGVEDLIESATTADDAEESKPAPDIVEVALSLAGAKPEDAVLLGDTPYDIAAAERAGVAAIAVRSGGWSDADLSRAVAIYDDVADLLAHWDAAVRNR